MGEKRPQDAMVLKKRKATKTKNAKKCREKDHN
jgi:hypothetical protein